MPVDDTRLRDLLEQSQDIHSDAMRVSRSELDELVELGHDDRRNGDVADAPVPMPQRRDALLGGLPKTGVLAGAGLGTAMVALIASPAFADKTMDVQMLQTAASIENLAVAAYTTALTLDFIGGGSANGVVKAFVETTKMQHEEHAKAFNAAATRLGGKAQNEPDPVLLDVVNGAVPSLTDAAKVVDLALELENGAAATYVANVGEFTNKNGRSVTAQHHGGRGAARRDPVRGEGLARGRRRRAHRAAARRGRVACRRRQRRLPRRVLPDRGRPSRDRRSSQVRRWKKHPEAMPVDEREVRALTADLQDVHHESLPSMRESLARVARLRPGRGRWAGGAGVHTDQPTPVPPRRRRARRWRRAGRKRRLRTGSRGRASGSSGVLARSMAASSSGQKLTGDLAVVGLAAALENLAVGTYQAGIDAATAGKLGAVPPAVVEFAMTAQRHHQDHAARGTACSPARARSRSPASTSRSRSRSTRPSARSPTSAGWPSSRSTSRTSQSATYLAAIDGVKSKPGIQTAATIQPVELQHAAILLFVLGEYPVPDAFAKQTGARSPSDKIGAAS